MPGTIKKSAASGRLFRRHTDNEVLGGKRKRSMGRKKIIRRGSRLVSSMRLRSLSRFSTFSSDGGSETLPSPDDVLIGSDTASTSMSSVESLSVSSTVIDIHETMTESSNMKDVKQDRDDNDYEEHNSCDGFFSKLLDLIQCFPHKQEEPPNREIDAVDPPDYTMRIECILEQTNDEESDGMDSMVSRLNDTPHLPKPPPSEWVQEPLLLVATPSSRSEMKICRIRRVSEPSFFESPEPFNSETIEQRGCCNNQVIQQLPINNGKEPPLQARVIDFETNLFSGTALFRIRGSKDSNSIQPMTPIDEVKNSIAPHDYFAKQNRKFQMVIRGKFKRDVVMADCMSGLLLDHHLATSKNPNVNCADGLPCESATGVKVDTKFKSKRPRLLKRGKSSSDDSLPPTWALRAAVKVAAVFSPRMDADLECSHPRILSPLCSTAQTISVSRKLSREGGPTHLDEKHTEPSPRDDASLVNDLNILPAKMPDSNGTDYVQQRKRAFDAAYDARVQSLAKSHGQGNVSPCFDPEAEYTFEFLQHLIDYNDLSLDLGKVLGKVRLGGALRGQPIRFISGAVKKRNSEAPAESTMSMDDIDCIWSFDLWHKSLIAK